MNEGNIITYPAGTIIIDAQEYPEVAYYFGTDIITKHVKMSEFCYEELMYAVKTGKAKVVHAGDKVCRREDNTLYIVGREEK